jgi:hypothetical protein
VSSQNSICGVVNAADAESACSRHPECLGYLVPNPGSSWIRPAFPNMVQLVSTTPTPSTNAGEASGTFYKKT